MSRKNLIDVHFLDANGETMTCPLLYTGAANLLGAIELMQWLSDNDGVPRWLTVNGVEIHSGSIVTLADAKRVVAQIKAGTYVKPDLPPCRSPLEYQGHAYFWNIEFKHPLREEATPGFRRMVRKEFIASGLELCGYTISHVAAINRVEKRLRRVELTEYKFINPATGYYTVGFVPARPERQPLINVA